MKGRFRWLDPVMRLAIFLLLVLCLLPSGWVGASETPRLAILADEQAAPFADLLTAALSKEPSFHLVERAELKRIEAEARLADLSAPERPLALARLAKADALLFIGTETGEDKVTHLTLRLTATADGSVRRAFVLPALPGQIEDNVRLAAKQLAAPLQRLTRSSGDKPKTISFQGFRASVDEPALHWLENSLNIRLAHRLANEAGLVLLERWQLDDVVFERTLALKKMPPLATGTRLLDGSFSKSDKNIDFRIRLRNSEQDPGTVLKLCVPDDDLAAMVESLAAEITHHTLSQTSLTPWKPEAEASAYSELGTWLLRHQLNLDAAQAFETAIALGDGSSCSLAGRAQAYALCAYPMDFDSIYGQDGGYHRDTLKAKNLPFHLSSAARAVQHAADYVQSHPSAPDPIKNPFEIPERLGVHVFYSALRTLRTVHDSRQQIELAPMVNQLREAIYHLGGRLDAYPLGSFYKWSYRKYKANYAAYWNTTPAETLGYYRKILAADYCADSPTWMVGIRQEFVYHKYHGPFLDGEVPPEDSFDVGTARLIDWRAPDSTSVSQPWKAFIGSLKNSSVLLDQANGLAFELGSHTKPDSRLRLHAETVDFLWNHRDLLTQSAGDPLFAGFCFRDLAHLPGASQTHARLVAVYRHVFEHSAWVPSLYFGSVWTLKSDYDYSNLHSEDARDLIKSMDGYQQRVQKDPRYTEEYAAKIAAARNTLIAKFPELATKPAEKESVPLVVGTVWNPYRQSFFPKNEYNALHASSLAFAEERLWITHCNVGILSIHPDTLETTVIPYPSDPAIRRGFYGPSQMIITPQALFGFSAKTIWRYDRSAKNWSKLDLPVGEYNLGRIRSGAWAVLNDESGFGVVDLMAPAPQWLVSSRRRPPEHPLDSGQFEKTKGIFPGPGNHPWVAFTQRQRPSSLVYDLDSPKKPKFSSDYLWIKDEFPRTLLWGTVHYAGGVHTWVHGWLVDPARPEPELLLCNPDHAKPPSGVTPRWPYPPSLSKTTATQNPNYCPALHEDELWILRWERVASSWGADSLELFGFLPGVTQPVRIPLRIKISPEDLAALPENMRDKKNDTLGQPSIEREGVVNTKRGLVFGGRGSHFLYIIPWDDIHAWIKSNSGAVSPTPAKENIPPK